MIFYRAGSPGTVGNLHAGTLALPATTLRGWAVAGTGAAEAGAQGTAIHVGTGCPRRPDPEVPIHCEVPRLGSRDRERVREGKTVTLRKGKGPQWKSCVTVEKQSRMRQTNSKKRKAKQWQA